MGEHERAYLAEIRRHLWNVPSMDRRPLLEQAADHLAERPPAESERGLAEALGKPGEYAATLRREAGLPTRFSRWQRLRGQQRRILLAEMTAIATLVIGSIGAWVWFTAVPELYSFCGGTHAGEVETREAAGVTEKVVTFRAQERLGILVCPTSSDSGVTINRIRIPQDQQSFAEPVGYEVRDEEHGGRFLGRAGPLEPFDARDGLTRSHQIRIWFEFDNCGINGLHAIQFDRFRIDYEYRWRHRSVDLDLLNVTTITSDSCFIDPNSQAEREAARARIDAELTAWWAAIPVNSRNPTRYDRTGLGPVNLPIDDIGRDLCRYLRGVLPSSGDYDMVPGAAEPLEARAVFNLGHENDELAVEIIDASLEAFCPEFADRRTELVTILADR